VNSSAPRTASPALGSASVIVAVALTVSCVVSPVVASSPVAISNAKPSAIADDAGEHGDFFATGVAREEAVPRELYEMSAGIFHHLEKLYAEIFNHRTVYFDHLVARHHGDRFPPVVDHDFDRPHKSATTATTHQVPSSTMKGGNSMR